MYQAPYYIIPQPLYGAEESIGGGEEGNGTDTELQQPMQLYLSASPAAYPMRASPPLAEGDRIYAIQTQSGPAISIAPPPSRNPPIVSTRSAAAPAAAAPSRTLSVAKSSGPTPGSEVVLVRTAPSSLAATGSPGSTPIAAEVVGAGAGTAEAIAIPPEGCAIARPAEPSYPRRTVFDILPPGSSTRLPTKQAVPLRMFELSVNGVPYTYVALEGWSHTMSDFLRDAEESTPRDREVAIEVSCPGASPGLASETAQAADPGALRRHAMGEAASSYRNAKATAVLPVHGGYPSASIAGLELMRRPPTHFEDAYFLLAAYGITWTQELDLRQLYCLLDAARDADLPLSPRPWIQRAASLVYDPSTLYALTNVIGVEFDYLMGLEEDAAEDEDEAAEASELAEAAYAEGGGSGALGFPVRRRGGWCYGRAGGMAMTRVDVASMLAPAMMRCLESDSLRPIIPTRGGGEGRESGLHGATMIGTARPRGTRRGSRRAEPGSPWDIRDRETRALAVTLTALAFAHPAVVRDPSLSRGDGDFGSERWSLSRSGGEGWRRIGAEVAEEAQDEAAVARAEIGAAEAAGRKGASAVRTGLQALSRASLESDAARDIWEERGLTSGAVATHAGAGMGLGGVSPVPLIDPTWNDLMIRTLGVAYARERQWLGPPTLVGGYFVALADGLVDVAQAERAAMDEVGAGPIIPWEAIPEVLSGSPDNAEVARTFLVRLGAFDLESSGAAVSQLDAAVERCLDAWFMVKRTPSDVVVRRLDGTVESWPNLRWWDYRPPRGAVFLAGEAVPVVRPFRPGWDRIVVRVAPNELLYGVDPMNPGVPLPAGWPFTGFVTTSEDPLVMVLDLVSMGSVVDSNPEVLDTLAARCGRA